MGSLYPTNPTSYYPNGGLSMYSTAGANPSTGLAGNPYASLAATTGLGLSGSVSPYTQMQSSPYGISGMPAGMNPSDPSMAGATGLGLSGSVSPYAPTQISPYSTILPGENPYNAMPPALNAFNQAPASGTDPNSGMNNVVAAQTVTQASLDMQQSMDDLKSSVDSTMQQDDLVNPYTTPQHPFKELFMAIFNSMSSQTNNALKVYSATGGPPPPRPSQQPQAPTPASAPTS